MIDGAAAPRTSFAISMGEVAEVHAFATGTEMILIIWITMWSSRAICRRIRWKTVRFLDGWLPVPVQHRSAGNQSGPVMSNRFYARWICFLSGRLDGVRFDHAQSPAPWTIICSGEEFNDLIDAIINDGKALRIVEDDKVDGYRSCDHLIGVDQNRVTS